jgi:hypothetical protein
VAEPDELARPATRPRSWSTVPADKNPLEDVFEQALDAFVYAPLGLLFDGLASFPTLVRNGRSQVSNARMMGQLTVRMGQTEVQKRAAELDGPVLDLLRGLGIVPAGSAPAAPDPTATTDSAASTSASRPAAPVAKSAKKAVGTIAEATSDASANRTAAKAAAANRNAATDAATPSAEVLPIPDYDSLSASQVVSRLRGLAPGQLEAVRAYESATRGRKTILNRIQQLSKP